MSKHEAVMSITKHRRVCFDGVRSAMETTSAMVKFALELGLVSETREVEVLESYEQGADTSRSHSSVTEVKGMCRRGTSVKHIRGRT